MVTTKITAMRLMILALSVSLSFAVAAQAQLRVSVSTLKIIGDKAVVRLTMRNDLPIGIKSAKAVLFVIDSDAKVVGRESRWVIGNRSAPELSSGGTNVFNFVITSAIPISTTNLTSKVQFNRVVLENGQLVDIPTQVRIQQPNPK